VVNAAGPWSKHLTATAELELQLRAVREQDAIWQVRPNRPMPECSFSTAIEPAYCRALGDGRFILGLGYPKPYSSWTRTTTSAPWTTISARLPNLEGAKFLSAHAAFYDITPDFYPFVGPRSGLAGYADFCGGSEHGFKIAPGLSKHLAQWLLDGKTDDEFADLSYDRLARGKRFGRPRRKSFCPPEVAD
jgi:glycine/D-amino acid oxidase-like deaminating enzyme